MVLFSVSTSCAHKHFICITFHLFERLETYGTFDILLAEQCPCAEDTKQCRLIEVKGSKELGIKEIIILLLTLSSQLAECSHGSYTLANLNSSISITQIPAQLLFLPEVFSLKLVILFGFDTKMNASSY